jgi:hypothetical protein
MEQCWTVSEDTFNKIKKKSKHCGLLVGQLKHTSVYEFRCSPYKFQRGIVYAEVCMSVVFSMNDFNLPCNCLINTNLSLTAQYIVFMLLHVSATDRSHLQGVTVLEDT